MPNEEAKTLAMKNIGMAMKSLDDEEKEYLKELQGQIRDAMAADPSIDKQMEFCYGVIFAPDRIKNDLMIKACRKYIDASE